MRATAPWSAARWRWPPWRWTSWSAPSRRRRCWPGAPRAGRWTAAAQLHIRLYTRAPLDQIAGVLVDAGFEEPAIQTIDTRHGRANRLRMPH